MGNSESESMQMPPIMKKLKDSLNLETIEGTDHTLSMIHNSFSSQIWKLEGSKINRQLSPFCPLDIQNDSNWITTCFVSPSMLVASPLYLCDKHGQLEKELTALPVYQSRIEKTQVKDVIMVERLNVCLLVLEQPCWKVGWAGISYINSIEDIRTQNLKIFNHPQRISHQDSDEMFHLQYARKFVLPQHPTQINQYAVEVKGLIGSLICKIVNKKPYVIGVQASENEAVFFSFKIYLKFNQLTKAYLSKYHREREIMKKINIVDFQMETQW